MTYAIKPAVEWPEETAEQLRRGLGYLAHLTDVPECHADRLLNRALMPGLHDLEQIAALRDYAAVLVAALAERSDPTYWQRGMGHNGENARRLALVMERYHLRACEARDILQDTYWDLVERSEPEVRQWASEAGLG